MTDAREIARVRRELGKLETLAGRRRLRVALRRALRGMLGAGGTFAAMLKFKLAGSLALKLALAAIVGLGFAWPFAALAILVVLGFVVAVIGLFSGEGGSAHLDCDCPCDCQRREARAARLEQAIVQRQAWLAAPAGPAPKVLVRASRGR